MKPKEILELEKFYKIKLNSFDTLEANTNFDISNTYFIDEKNQLIGLILSGNGISDLNPIQHLIHLQSLDLSYNNISDLKPIQYLIHLQKLYLEFNQITDLNPIQNLTLLEELYLSNNQITDINQFEFIVELKFLIRLIIDENPFNEKLDLKFPTRKNHLDELKSYLIRQQEVNKLTIKLPAKVLFLGNHASGKSTFLNYFINEDEQKKIKKLNSTHILQIHQYKKEDNNHKLPKAIIFDFGGQDYYHGIYKAFLTNNAINLLFFKSAHDKNQRVSDSEDNTKQTYTFSREYWIHQLNYYHQYENKTISLIQTHADTDTRCTYQNSRSSIHIDHEFFVGLNNDALNKKSNQLSLDYLEAILNEKIEENRKEIEEPQWYINFLNYIANYSIASSINISEVKEHYKREKVDESLFISDLKQLCEQGLILFYPEIESIKHIAWLNPSATILHIHNEVLTKELLLNNNGIIKKENFEEKVNKDIIELLKVHKVIFLDETNKDNPEYIIPGYLKNANEQKEEYFMLSDFDDPSFVLKFEYFIPFGFMNQLICKYGANPDKKLYWKDQLLFTYENNARVLIQLNFEELEIKVFIKFKKNQKNENHTLENKILKDIIDIYYDRKPEKQIEIDNDNEDNTDSKKLRNVENIIDNRIPDDLYFSLDNLYFVHFQTLNDESKTSNEIISYKRNDQFKLDKANGKTLSSRRFKNFTKNKNIMNMKKIFISYSRKDFEFKNELKNHLQTLRLFDIADAWSCDEINIGNWDEQIQKELLESDLIIYMLSPNFFSSRYILEKEVQVGFDLIEQNKNKDILCVIVDDFVSLDKLFLPEDQRSNLQESILKLSQKQYLPYSTNYNKITNQDEEKIKPLKRQAYEGTISSAYVQIVNKILDYLKINY